MLTRMRTALKFMTYGLVIGLLFAPRRGADTRRELVRWATSTVRDLPGGIRGAMGAQR
ncbi:YtxH domain-containing protein [Sphaerobacter sp.]|uniref:YtxH domain-containing protein n=1 Tax=Sphaerobacter sp. TaxID=2099654 RepID=UPI001DAA25CF|nr:YtxH domain-containing protein [Sphaerobacter sp.]MBX5445130.1 YtxH domain-containing protein [Sphaerobacter sp.]